jgi:histidine ammonia-lyase
MDRTVLDGDTLSLEQLFHALEAHSPVTISKAGIERIRKSRSVIETILREGRIVYGVNTGFGRFSDVTISDEKIDSLQKNLVMSHATAVGEPFDDEIVRTAILLKINSFAKGYSGIRQVVVDTLVRMYNEGVIPIVPSMGSVGASGDLAPLAHVSLVLLGMGEATFRGTVMTGRQAMEQAGIRPVTLKAKEGLALVNGLQVSTALACTAMRRLENLLQTANLIAAMTLDGLRGTTTAFDARIQKARGMPGQIEVGHMITALLRGSEIGKSHRDCEKVQDAYSLRCIPQVHGTVRDALAFVHSILEKEINSCTDNPLIFADDGDVLSGGNFHGQPLALAGDLMAVVTTYLANISERRIEYMLDPNTSDMAGFLTREGGLNSGFMLAQVTAASLASASKVLAHPASIDSIPTSANKEDFVSMSCNAAAKAHEVMDHTEYILAIELLCACQAIDLKRPLKSSEPVEAAHRLVRDQIPHLSQDRVMYPDIEAAHRFVARGILTDTVSGWITLESDS